jgi:transcriptional regulator with XRE-family HTH domain
MRGVVTNGEKILALRNGAGLTQETLAAQAGCDVKTLRRAERSRRVDVATLRRIADYLAVEVRNLIADERADSRAANIVAVERFVGAFDARDPNAVADSFCEDGVVLTLADPSLPGAGEFRGREQIRRWAQVCFETFRTDPITPDNSRIDTIGDLVFLRLDRPQVEYLPTGKQAHVYLTSEFKVAGGLIAALWIYPESGAIERMAIPTASGAGD